MNVWVENGDVMIYVARSGMFDENNTLLESRTTKTAPYAQPV